MSEHCCKTDACRISDLEAERDKLTERVLAHERIEMDLMAQRDALKARVEKLEKGLKEIASDSLCCGSCSDCCTYEAQKLAKAALDEDGGN